MKLISLNIGLWIDNAAQVVELIKQENPDFVHLQEVTATEDSNIKPMFNSKAALDEAFSSLYPHRFFSPIFETHAIRVAGKIDHAFGGLIQQGNAIFSKHPFTHAENIFYYQDYKHMRDDDWEKWFQKDTGRALQSVIVDIDSSGTTQNLHLMNLHGIWTKDKLGDDRTEEETRTIVEIAQRYPDTPTIVAGDINLLPEAQSMQTLNKHFTNLISEYNISSTRPKIAEDNIDKGELVVDYVLVNDLVKVHSFFVPQTDMSDHLPLVCEFDLNT